MLLNVVVQNALAAFKTLAFGQPKTCENLLFKMLWAGYHARLVFTIACQDAGKMGLLRYTP